MKALLLAAGRGTRLGELSNTTPKCLQKVGNSTVLDRLVGQLIDAGVSELLINTHHLPEKVNEHIARAQWNVGINLVYEPCLLGTLGTLRANLDFFDGGPGWVLHADNVIEGNLIQLRKVFEARQVSVWGTILTFKVANPIDFGVITVNDQGVMTGFFEKVPRPPSDLASAATFIFGSLALDVVRQLPPSASDLSRDLLPLLAGHLEVVVHTRRILDIGTPESLAYAQQLNA